jgi:hypothetical protein
MTLYNKIIAVYPSLTIKDFYPNTGTIILQNDGQGNGDYIASWKNTEYPEPTQEQLDAVSSAA